MAVLLLTVELVAVATFVAVAGSAWRRATRLAMRPSAGGWCQLRVAVRPAVVLWAMGKLRSLAQVMFVVIGMNAFGEDAAQQPYVLSQVLRRASHDALPWTATAWILVLIVHVMAAMGSHRLDRVDRSVSAF
ncbi:MAG: hypothetical protein AAGH15_13625 [Myxococcota bacterium]